MKIVVLMGSPNRKGSTNILVEEFTRGAKENGHQAEVVNVCHADVHPCTGCVHCGYEGPCVQKDDGDYPPAITSVRYSCFCNAALLLWNDCTAENCGGPFVCI